MILLAWLAPCNIVCTWAVKLFKEGETSVIAVAVKVGFNDVKYFSKEFKKLYNVTPNEYLNCSAD
jgi:AraC-like DNA-binding protein